MKGAYRDGVIRARYQQQPSYIATGSRRRAYGSYASRWLTCRTDGGWRSDCTFLELRQTRLILRGKATKEADTSNAHRKPSKPALKCGQAERPLRASVLPDLGTRGSGSVLTRWRRPCILSSNVAIVHTSRPPRSKTYATTLSGSSAGICRLHARGVQEHGRNLHLRQIVR